MNTPASSAPSRAAVEELATGLGSLFQAFQRMKATLARSASPETQRERAAHVLLFPLCVEGPLRQTELAERVHTDPSTISRHVSRLVEQGLVTRVPDESDGRAAKLVVTDRGASTAEAMRRERAEHLRVVTSDWDEEDLATLAALLRRLADDIDDRTPTVAAR